MRYVLLVTGMALFGSATPVSKIVGEAFPSMLASGLRMATALAVLVPALAIVGGGRALVRAHARDRVLLAAIGAVGTFGFTLFLFYGMQNAPGAVGAVVMATTPAVTAAGAVLLLGSEADRWTLAAIGLAVGGVALVNVGVTPGAEGGRPLLGSLLVLAAVACEAVYTLLGKRLTIDLSPVAITFAAGLVAGLMFLAPAIWQARSFDWSSPATSDWLALAWWGGATMGAGSVAWFAGVHRVDGTTASAFMAVMPVSALVLSYVVLGEAFSWIHVVGMAVVLAALAVVVYRDAREPDTV